jgi:hypothetical protein
MLKKCILMPTRVNILATIGVKGIGRARRARAERRFQMNRTVMLVALALPIASLSFVSCKKEEAPPPLPSAAPATEPAPVLALETVKLPEPDAGTEVKKATGGGVAKTASNLQACCNALAQNAANAPEPTATYMKQAAATCGVLAAQGKDSGSAVAILAGLLKGAGLPAACK